MAHWPEKRRLRPKGPSQRRREPHRETPDPDRGRLKLVLAILALALLLPLGASLVLRGPGRKPQPEAETDAFTVEPLEDLSLDDDGAIKGSLEDSGRAEALPPPAIASTASSSPIAEAVPTNPPSASPPRPELLAAGAQKRVPKAPEADGPEENRLFTMELSGTLGGEDLDSADGQTWARLSYFLRDEAATPCFLVYPDGSIPLSMPKDPGKKKARRTPRTEAASPEGDPDSPTYRLVVHAVSSSRGAITFRGQKLASKFGCRVSCRIEKRAGDAFTLLRKITAEEYMNPLSGPDVDPRVCVRQLYDATIEKLAGELGALPLFKGR